MAASEASFWSLPQGGPTDFPSDAIVFRKLFTEVASARSACSSNCFSGIPRSLKTHAPAARSAVRCSRGLASLACREVHVKAVLNDLYRWRLRGCPGHARRKLARTPVNQNPARFLVPGLMAQSGHVVP